MVGARWPSSGDGTLMISRGSTVPVSQFSARVAHLPTRQQQSASGHGSDPAAGPTDGPLEQTGPYDRQPDDRKNEKTLAGFLMTVERTLGYNALDSILLCDSRPNRQPGTRGEQAGCDYYHGPGALGCRPAANGPQRSHNQDRQHDYEYYRKVDDGWMKRIGNHDIILLAVWCFESTPQSGHFARHWNPTNDANTGDFADIRQMT
jgi:hypothetical protein